MARHLGVSVVAILIAFVLLIVFAQLGPVLYVAFWILLPGGDAGRDRRPSRLLGGGVLIAMAVLGGGLPIAVLLALAGILAARLLRRAARQLTIERAYRKQEERRTELELVMHDRTLQTLALIQRHVEDPTDIQRLIGAHVGSLSRTVERRG